MKKRILIGFEAFNNDYTTRKDLLLKLEKDSISQSGTNFVLHQAFKDRLSLDEHILLFNEKNEHGKKASNVLANTINHFCYDDKTIVKAQSVKIKDVINVTEIKLHLLELLRNLSKENDIEEFIIFISPGTPAMQVAWYLIHFELSNIKTRLIQTRRASDSKNKQPELIEIEFEKSQIPYSLVKVQNDESIDSGIIMTPSIKSIYKDASAIAEADHTNNFEAINVLIQGDTGTGKEHLSQYIHKNSIRKNESFVAINCGAYLGDTLRSELFGYKKGSFTGADADKDGLFIQAHEGTIFLDEIGDISPEMQVLLLRTLESGEVRPLGSNKADKINVRVIAASHKNLKELCREGKFRWDLYYRLAVATLYIPALNNRGKEEINEYLEKFIKQFASILNREPLKIEGAIFQKLTNYDYPGNIREMINLIKRLYTFYPEGSIVENIKYLPELNEVSIADNDTLESVLAPIEENHIKNILRQTNGTVTKAVKILGISKNTLDSKLKKYNINKEEFKK